jgi:murein DD-endopeptidase MepM/ murein hydrolase activator NlpD
MARRGFFWFSAKWLSYRVWPAWIGLVARGLLLLVIAAFVAWGLALGYFYFFPSAAIVSIRQEVAAKTDSLETLRTRLASLKAEKTRIAELDSILYRELTAIPPREGTSVVRARAPNWPQGEVRADSLVQYVERAQALLARQMQLEEMLHRLSTRIAHLPRHRPIERGDLAVGFGPAYHPITLQVYEHKGVDFIVTPGTPVRVTADGVVREVSPLPFTESSYKVLVEHTPTLHTLYYPVDPTVRPGQLVGRGTRLGYVIRLSMARTTFLHYEVWRQGEAVEPLRYLWGDLSPDEIKTFQKAFQSPGYGLH